MPTTAVLRCARLNVNLDSRRRSHRIALRPETGDRKRRNAESRASRTTPQFSRRHGRIPRARPSNRRTCACRTRAILQLRMQDDSSKLPVKHWIQWRRSGAGLALTGKMAHDAPPVRAARDPAMEQSERSSADLPAVTLLAMAAIAPWRANRAHHPPTHMYAGAVLIVLNRNYGHSGSRLCQGGHRSSSRALDGIGDGGCIASRATRCTSAWSWHSWCRRPIRDVESLPADPDFRLDHPEEFHRSGGEVPRGNWGSTSHKAKCGAGSDSGRSLRQQPVERVGE
jgi:hypothetical protein